MDAEQPTEHEVEVTTYRLSVYMQTEPTEIHEFIMEALAEGRIDLAKANVLLKQCLHRGEAREL